MSRTYLERSEGATTSKSSPYLVYAVQAADDIRYVQKLLGMTYPDPLPGFLCL